MNIIDIFDIFNAKSNVTLVELKWKYSYSDKEKKNENILKFQILM